MHNRSADSFPNRLFLDARHMCECAAPMDQLPAARATAIEAASLAACSLADEIAVARTVA